MTTPRKRRYSDMDRSTFLKKLGLGVLAAPAVAKAEPVKAESVDVHIDPVEERLDPPPFLNRDYYNPDRKAVVYFDFMGCTKADVDALRDLCWERSWNVSFTFETDPPNLLSTMVPAVPARVTGVRGDAEGPSKHLDAVVAKIEALGGTVTMTGW
jgi:hypothetical protein